MHMYVTKLKLWKINEGSAGCVRKVIHADACSHKKWSNGRGASIHAASWTDLQMEDECKSR